MKITTFHQKEFLDRAQTEVFDFFSDPGNLSRISAPYLNFRILTPTPLVLREGLRIDYSVDLRGTSIRWASQVEVWDPPYRFLERQLTGPLCHWTHEQSFWEEEDGTWVEGLTEFAGPVNGTLARVFEDAGIRSLFRHRTLSLSRLWEEANEHLLSA